MARQVVARKANEPAFLLVESLVQLSGFSELGRANRGEIVGVAAHSPQLLTLNYMLAHTGFGCFSGWLCCYFAFCGVGVEDIEE